MLRPPAKMCFCTCLLLSGSQLLQLQADISGLDDPIDPSLVSACSSSLEGAMELKFASFCSS